MKTIVSTLNAKYIHTSLALRYLKAYARPKYDLDIKEFTIHEPPIDIASAIYAEKPDVIGFSCYIWNIEETIPVISILKKTLPDTLIVLGGPEVSYDSNYWMDRLPDVDIIVQGEGEATFQKLLGAIENNTNLNDIPGLMYRKNGKVMQTVPAPKISLDEIPSPFRFEEDLPYLSQRISYVETSRGCPFTCQFCLSSIEFGVRYFDIVRMKEELTFLMDHGAKTIKFLDRTFNINRKYALEMFDFIIKNHRPGTVFQFEITADIMRPEVLEFINEHAPEGLFRFEVGVQSTNDHTNKLIKRRQNFNKLTRTVTMVKDGGKVIQHLDLIAGLPEEDYQSFRKTFNDVFALRPEELQLGFLKMLRGTGLRIEADKWGYKYMDHAPYEMLENNVLSFEEVTRIKQVEDILEKFWNKHFMDHTIEYLMEHVFDSPFDFFQDFGSYWHEQQWNKIGHQLTDLFRRLHQYILEVKPEHAAMTEGFMHLDYYQNFKQKPRKGWNREAFSLDRKKTIYNELWDGMDFSTFDFTKKDLFKHTMLEHLPFQIETYLSTGDVEPTPSLMIAVYPPGANHVQFLQGMHAAYS
ncbi:B12-binding domain-containing radical SAM protein [Thalassobacillus pellis]|uniref:B12-binding domain-containing radical SAM protein n=1 Tax=Thalassobacillus pellis TaxID=748008 RepID=UPI00195FBE8E|nr:radical SAM protein [Thalassobacillus pellis]MBM7552984.1 radical SAM superfamily enzyme YgiQ (UPF0313 family) [Thalassobacillus pellis]